MTLQLKIMSNLSRDHSLEISHLVLVSSDWWKDIFWVFWRMFNTFSFYLAMSLNFGSLTQTTVVVLSLKKMYSQIVYLHNYSVKNYSRLSKLHVFFRDKYCLNWTLILPAWLQIWLPKYKTSVTNLALTNKIERNL